MQRKRTALTGLAFLVSLVLSYYENAIFFNSFPVVSKNQILFFLAIIMNNLVVISLVLLGMAFYVSLVTSNFFKNDKYAYVVLEHPRIFAMIFALIILLISILKGVNLFLGTIILETLPMIFLVSAPVGTLEGYGIYVTIKKTLKRTISVKDLIYIYGIFVIAAVVEVSFTNILR